MDDYCHSVGRKTKTRDDIKEAIIKALLKLDSQQKRYRTYLLVLGNNLFHYKECMRDPLSVRIIDFTSFQFNVKSIERKYIIIMELINRLL